MKAKTCFSLQIKSLIFLTVTIFFISNFSTYAQYKRNIIFEEFSEVWCGPCAAVAPMLTAWLENHPDYNTIAYYSYFMVNGKRVNSPSEYQYRKSFYSVPFFPFAVINSVKAPNTAYPGYPTDTSKINYIIDTMTTTSALKIDMDFTNKGKTGNVSLQITSSEKLENINLFVYLVEKHHTYAKQPNNQTEFHHIMRKSLPDFDGEPISINAGETKNYSFDYEFNDNIDIDYNMFAVAIIQDENTKYIYQSESIFEPVTIGIEENSQKQSINIYPNPAYNIVNINVSGNPVFISDLEIVNILGNVVNTYKINGLLKNFSINCSDSNNEKLPAGIYFIKMKVKNKLIIKKLIIE